MAKTHTGNRAARRSPAMRRGARAMASGLRTLGLAGAICGVAWAAGLADNNTRAPADGSGTLTVPRGANFGAEQPAASTRRLADWIVATNNHQAQPFALVDKSAARVYVFAPDGTLTGAAAALLGLARGDDTVPGIGTRPMAQIQPQERTTPAGRFVAKPGRNMSGEDVLWVDYDAAVSMHRVRALVAAERRLERLATPTPDDNRISYGCINVPVAFYEGVLMPAFGRTQGVVYVLPEVRTLQEVFGL